MHNFEPASDTRARLVNNVEANGLSGLVKVYPRAVSDRPGTLRLKAAAQAGHRSLFDSVYVDTERSEDVWAINLDEALAMTGEEEIDLLKIDIEGAEIEVVEGATAAAWSKVRRVVVEYHNLIRPGCRDRVLQALRAQGFDPIEVLAEESTPDLGIIRARRGSARA